MDRRTNHIARIYCDRDAASKLAERGELPTHFRGRVEFYEYIDGRVGYVVHPEGKEPFVRLGEGRSLREAGIHFMRFGSKEPED